ncbi:hypothetical protein D3C78_738510 [compost metagenome]
MNARGEQDDQVGGAGAAAGGAEQPAQQGHLGEERHGRDGAVGLFRAQATQEHAFPVLELHPGGDAPGVGDDVGGGLVVGDAGGGLVDLQLDGVGRGDEGGDLEGDAHILADDGLEGVAGRGGAAGGLAGDEGHVLADDDGGRLAVEGEQLRGGEDAVVAGGLHRLQEGREGRAGEGEAEAEVGLVGGAQGDPGEVGALAVEADVEAQGFEVAVGQLGDHGGDDDLAPWPVDFLDHLADDVELVAAGGDDQGVGGGRRADHGAAGVAVLGLGPGAEHVVDAGGAHEVPPVAQGSREAAAPVAGRQHGVGTLVVALVVLLGGVVVRVELFAAVVPVIHLGRVELGAVLDDGLVQLGQAATPAAEGEQAQRQAEDEGQLQAVPTVDVDDVLGNGFAHLLVDDVDVLHAEPEVPAALAQVEEELEQVGAAALVPVAGVEPDAGFVQEDPAEHFFVVGFVADAEAAQVGAGGQVGQAHEARVGVVGLAELVHEDVDVDGDAAAGLEVFEDLHDQQQGFARAELAGDDVDGHGRLRCG